ncbi:venom serine carboxypeptidase-like isoform X2 [Haemaphysalis longicornis]
MQLDTPFLLFTIPFIGLLNHWFLGQANAKECRHWDGRNQDEALFLTPLILSGQLEEAKALSEVCALPADVEVPSYSGFITVNAEFNSNLFFWFVPSLTDPKNAPVLLWLQGGPFASSLLGFFVEHGPYSVPSDFTEATFRPMTWTNRYSVLYVDQPVGTGFSFTDDEAGYSRNLTDVGRDMLEFLQQFFTLFDDLAQNEFYITGESYGGKYVPAVGAAVHKNAALMRVKINFRGIAYGNGFTDPVNMLEVGEFAYATGLIDRTAADYMKNVAAESRKHIRAGRTELAFHNMNHLFIGHTKTRDSFFKNITGFEYVYNYLHNKVPKDVRNYHHFVAMPAVRRAIHVGQRNFSIAREAAFTNFFEDFMRSAVPQLTILLENGYRVLVYSGQLDIAVPTTNTENFLSKMSWSGAGRWARAPQHQWRSADGHILYGYKKTVDNLHFVVVRNSGHLVPYDTPQAAFSLITAFVDARKPFDG